MSISLVKFLPLERAGAPTPVDTMTTIDFDSELSLDWPGIVLDDSPLAASMLP